MEDNEFANTLEPFTSNSRLPSHVLRRATPEHIWNSVQRFLQGRVAHPFGPSTDYDLIADDGTRLPPKAVFGVALSMALGGIRIGPKHFSAGVNSPCFRLLRAAGYHIVLKGEEAPAVERELLEGLQSDKQYWEEGALRLVSHLKRERGSGLAQAKKAQFKRLHGTLICEHCRLDPVGHYGTPHGEACIEVHHHAVYGEQHDARPQDDAR